VHDSFLNEKTKQISNQLHATVLLQQQVEKKENNKHKISLALTVATLNLRFGPPHWHLFMDYRGH